MELTVRRVAHGSDEHDRSVQLRKEILRWPLGLDLTQADLEQERDEIVLIAELEGRLVGTLNLRPLPEKRLKMRQVAVRPEMQRMGVGRALVRESELLGRSLGAVRMELNARLTAVPFYLSLGYGLEGEPFEEVTIPHRKMVKNL